MIFFSSSISLRSFRSSPSLELNAPFFKDFNLTRFLSIWIYVENSWMAFQYWTRRCDGQNLQFFRCVIYFGVFFVELSKVRWRSMKCVQRAFSVCLPFTFTFWNLRPFLNEFSLAWVFRTRPEVIYFANTWTESKSHYNAAQMCLETLNQTTRQDSLLWCSENYTCRHFTE